VIVFWSNSAMPHLSRAASAAWLVAREVLEFVGLVAALVIFSAAVVALIPLRCWSKLRAKARSGKSASSSEFRTGISRLIHNYHSPK
jgi:hypothetical protein